ncbi:MAG: hypothetical protein ACFFDN_08330 [Candidatus Hodarchaeota archaeon]
MAKARKTKKIPKITENPKKTLKKRGRPPGSTKKKIIDDGKVRDGLPDTIKDPKYGKNLSTDDYDSMLIEQLKTNRKAKEKAFKDEYEIDEIDDEEEEETETYIEGYDIELPEGEEFEEDLISPPKKGRRKKRKNYYDEVGIETEFYDSDYYIGDYE